MYLKQFSELDTDTGVQMIHDFATVTEGRKGDGVDLRPHCRWHTLGLGSPRGLGDQGQLLLDLGDQGQLLLDLGGKEALGGREARRKED